MRSKIIILLVTAAFLLGAVTPAMAHSGRISNLINEPEEADEHPWGGGNEGGDGPESVYATVQGPVSVFSNDAMISFGLNFMWISIKHIFWTPDVTSQPGIDSKSGGSAVHIPGIPNNNNSNSGMGTN